jgi:hypothetical protein
MAQTINQLQRQISDVSPSEFGNVYKEQKRPQQMEILARHQVIGRVSHLDLGVQKQASEKQRE